MKRYVLPSLLPLFLAIILAGCASTTLVCDKCGVAFTASGDYSEELAEDADLETLYGIDIYHFYCPDCIHEGVPGPLLTTTVSFDDAEKVRAYRESKKNKDDVSAKQEGKIPGALVRSTGEDSFWVCETTDGMYGIYDESIQALVNEARYEQIADFDEAGMARAYSGGYWGCIDQRGNQVVAFQFSDIQPFQGDYAIAKINSYGVIDRSGTFVIEPMYDEIKLYENVAQVKADDSYGFVDYNGQIMAEPKYASEPQFIGPYIYAGGEENAYGTTWGDLFDQSGQSLMGKLPVENLTQVSYAGEGMIRARREGTTLDAQYHGLKEIYLLNEDLELVTEQPYLYVSDFSHSGYAAARPLESYHKGYWSLEVNDDGWTVIDKAGGWVASLPELSGGFAYNGYSSHYTYVNQDFAVADEKNGNYFLVDLHSGEKNQYEYIWTFEDSNCICVKDIGTELFSLYNGHELIDSQCTEIKTLSTDDGKVVGFNLFHGATETKYTIPQE